jgi:HAD superfamily hydrolase (TIGR01493 family)
MTIKAIVFDAYGTLYDTQSVAAITDEAFPGYGEMITQIWRLKQLEYSWLHSLMCRYEDFSVITRDALVYTLRALGLKYDTRVFERIMDKYVHLDLYPDARQALAGLKDYKLAILSNGSTDMLTTLVPQYRPGKGPPCHDQHRLETRLQAEPRGLFIGGSAPRDCTCRSSLRFIEPVGCDRSKVSRVQHGLDRTRHAGGDGGELPE